MKFKIFTSESKEKLYYSCLFSIQGSDDIKSQQHKECAIMAEIRIVYITMSQPRKIKF